jgi:hypothetical protein
MTGFWKGRTERIEPKALRENNVTIIFFVGEGGEQFELVKLLARGA